MYLLFYFYFILLDAVILETEKGNRTRIIWEPSILKGLSESGVLGKFQLNYHFNSEESLNDIVVRKHPNCKIELFLISPYIYVSNRFEMVTLFIALILEI